MRGRCWFGSADNKSRIGFLTPRHDGQPSYVLNDLALAHLHDRLTNAGKVPPLADLMRQRVA